MEVQDGQVVVNSGNRPHTAELSAERRDFFVFSFWRRHRHHHYRHHLHRSCSCSRVPTPPLILWLVMVLLVSLFLVKEGQQERRGGVGGLSWGHAFCPSSLTVNVNQQQKWHRYYFGGGRHHPRRRRRRTRTTQPGIDRRGNRIIVDVDVGSLPALWLANPQRRQSNQSYDDAAAESYFDKYEDHYDYYEEDGYDDKDLDLEEEQEQEEEQADVRPKSNSNVYKVIFNNNVDPSETQLTWETCNYLPDYDDDEYADPQRRETQALVLLPPAAVTKPSVILHFVGGTFFGSSPKLFYRKFLEGIVRNTQAAVIVTPIPVTLFSSPLDHVRLATKLQQAFDYAYFQVLEDEYTQEGLQDVPLCGIGHSLGARLLTVMTTRNQNSRPNRQRNNNSSSNNNNNNNIPPPYKSMVLISFTNYGAQAGIPGVGTLLRQSRQQERKVQVQQERQRYQRARSARNDYYNNYNNYDYDSNDNDNDDDEQRRRMEEEWAEVMDDLTTLMTEQADRVKKALTPKTKDLEFRPSPTQLWRAIQDDGRYQVNSTLVVQFDNDVIDQSSKLAQILVDTNSSNVAFARLRGTHLTPLSLLEGDAAGELDIRQVARSDGGDIGGGARSSSLLSSVLSSRAGKSLYSALIGRSKTKEQAESMRDLRQSVVSYITDVVTK